MLLKPCSPIFESFIDEFPLLDGFWPLTDFRAIHTPTFSRPETRPDTPSSGQRRLADAIARSTVAAAPRCCMHRSVAHRWRDGGDISPLDPPCTATSFAVVTVSVFVAVAMTVSVIVPLVGDGKHPRVTLAFNRHSDAGCGVLVMQHRTQSLVG